MFPVSYPRVANNHNRIVDENVHPSPSWFPLYFTIRSVQVTRILFHVFCRDGEPLPSMLSVTWPWTTLRLQIQNCHARPQYYDPATGKLHGYCSKACANATTSNTTTSSSNCDVSTSAGFWFNSLTWMCKYFSTVKLVLNFGMVRKRIRTVENLVHKLRNRMEHLLRSDDQR